MPSDKNAAYMAQYREKIASKLSQWLAPAELRQISCDNCKLLKACHVLERNGMEVCCELSDEEADIPQYAGHSDSWLKRLHEDLREEDDPMHMTTEETYEMLGWGKGNKKRRHGPPPPLRSRYSR